MRQVTKDAVSAFKSDVPGTFANTRIEVREGGTFMYLHGNMIAHKQGDDLFITTCGWRSNVTKERLNGILETFGLPKISQRNWEWFIGSESFDQQRKTFKI